MPLAIALSFLAGRFHSTPWGHHVNEGLPEWPPSPWRFLRALVATWKRKLSSEQAVNSTLPGILAKLTAPVLFFLPSASLGHTRHYMPWKGPQDRTLVFDAFVALDPAAEVVFLWPEVALDAPEEQVLRLVLSQLSYFGRAESWCTARLSDEWELDRNGAWIRIDKVKNTVMAKVNCFPLNGGVPDTTEPVRILAADQTKWQQWSYGGRARRPDPPWNLLAETADLHAERWSDPPGSRWLTYLRPVNAFAVSNLRRHVIRKTAPLTVACYALDGTVLPLVQETLSVAELARRYLQGIYGRYNNKIPSALFSGKTIEGVPLQDHRHAFYLPTDDDNDGRLDHLTVYAPGQAGAGGQDLGFGEGELHALDQFRRLRQVGGKPDLQLVLLGLGTRDNWREVPVLGRSQYWRSTTPFVPPRHQKTRGRKRETPEEQLRDELRRRGFLDPITISPMPRYEMEGRSIRWLEFRRERLFGDGSRGQGFGYGFTVEFADPVAGPLCFGYGCHFGLGLFVPVQA